MVQISGLTVEVADLIEKEVAEQISNGFNPINELSMATSLVSIRDEAVLMYTAKGNNEAVRKHAIRIAAYAVRVVQEQC